MINLNMHEGSALLLRYAAENSWALATPDHDIHMGIGVHRFIVDWDGQVFDQHHPDAIDLDQWSGAMVTRMHAHRLTQAQVAQLEMLARHVGGGRSWHAAAERFAATHLGEFEGCVV